MAEKLTAQTAAVGGDVTDDDLLYLVNDPSGTPASRKITVATLMQAAAVRELLLDYLGDTVWQSGGGITVTHSDGGNTLTLGATGVLEDLNTLGASTTDGEFLVATGAGTLAWESGATARTSIGLGSVEDTALSTWAGTSNITTVGEAAVTAHEAALSITESQISDFGTYGTAAAVALNTTHRTSDGSDHTFIDQDVTSGSTPTFGGANITGVATVLEAAVTAHEAALTVTASQVSDFSTAADARIALAVLDDLADVTETTITTGDLLRWNGSAWVNYADSNFGSASDVSSNTTHRTSDGSDHTFIDQDVTSGASPTLDGTNITGVPAASILAGTFGTGNYTLSDDKDVVLQLRSTKNDASWTAGTDTFGAIEWYSSDGSGTGAGVAASIRAEVQSSSGNGGDLVFSADGAALDTEHFRAGGDEIIVNSIPLSGITTLTATTLNGTLGTAAQPNVTSVGTLTGLTVNDFEVDISAATSVDVSAQNDYSFVIGDNGANQPAISSKTSAANTPALIVIAASNNTNTNADMLFSVRESDNTDFADVTTAKAFKWNRYTTELMHLTRGGALLVNQDLTLASGSITSASGAISFGNETLTGTGAIVLGSTGGQGVTYSDNAVTYHRAGTSYINFGLNDGSYGLRFRRGSGYADTLVIDNSGNFDFQSGTITTTGTATSAGLISTSAVTLKREVGNSYITLYGGTGGTTGAEILVTGSTYALASQILLDATTLKLRTVNGAATVATWNTAGLTFDSGGTITTTGAISGGAGTFTGDLSATGKIQTTRGGGNWELVGSGGDLYLDSGGVDLHRFTAGGDVMIGSSGSPDGTLHVHTASAGAVTANTAADDLVIENNASGGISILTSDGGYGALYFGSPATNTGATLQWSHTNDHLSLAARKVGAITYLRADNNVTNLTLSGASGSELATFAGDVTLSAGGVTASGAGTNVTGTWNYNARIQNAAQDRGITLGFDTAVAGAGIIASNGGTSSIAFWTHDGGWAERARFDSAAGNFLLGATATSLEAQFYATKTYSNASGNNQGMKGNYVQSVATTGEFSAFATAATATHTSGTVGGLLGIVPTVVVSGAGGATTSAYAGRFAVQNTNASATITNAYGVYVSAFTATGTITNRWGIYQAGASENNYLAGDLRIGTTSGTSHAQEALVVETSGGGTKAVFESADTGNSTIQFANSSTGNSATDGFVIGISNGGSTADLTMREAGAMTFSTAFVERLRIASDAYAIGIGTTDVESWNSSYGAVEFGASAIMGSTASTNGYLFLLQNAYYDGTWKYKATDEAARFTIEDEGLFTWHTAASGTIDTAITWSEKMRLSNAGMVLIGDTANANMTVGLTINQGANDDEAFALKSSDVATALTSLAETDTYFNIQKASGPYGGAKVSAFAEASGFGLTLESWSGESTSQNSSSGGIVMINAGRNNAGTAAAPQANSNLLAVRASDGAGGWNAKFLVDAEGDYHYDGADGGAFDAYQDAQMVRAFATATSKNTLRTAHDDWVQYNEQDLVDIGVLGAPVAEGGLINGAQLQRLHTGAIWQNYTMIADTTSRVDQLESELAEQKALVNTLQKQLGQA